MADKVLVTIGVLRGSIFPALADLTAKGGKIVVTSVAPVTEQSLDLPLTGFLLSNKSIVGNVMGLTNLLVDLPRLIDHYRVGNLNLDGLVTSTYKLDDINQAYSDMKDGKNIRGVIHY